MLQPLVPDKKYMRKDPYDHQTGEAEYIDCPISPEDIDTKQEIIEIKEIQ